MNNPQSENTLKPKPKIGEEMTKASQPHEALFLVLAYLNLFEHLTLSQVCKSLRDAIHDDVLLWLDIVIEPPVNFRINDEILLKFTSMAQGRLRSLLLMNCIRITDDGLQRVIENNPDINKLYIPSCTQLTPNGVLRAVKTLTEHTNNKKLKFIRLENIYNLNKNHLEVIYSDLRINPGEQKPKLYLQNGSDSNRIDIELCPKCKEVRIVFECPRESCRSKNEKPLTACKGCLLCIPRCEGCGGCVDQDETGETACLDIVCLECWLRLPKCNLCNKPYCNRHSDRIQLSEPISSGFVCDSCSSEMEHWLGSPC